MSFKCVIVRHIGAWFTMELYEFMLGLGTLYREIGGEKDYAVFGHCINQFHRKCIDAFRKLKLIAD